MRQGTAPSANPSPDDRVAEVGELAALARIIPLLPTGALTQVGPGDDAAVVGTPDGRAVITTDTMMEGADFRLDWSTWRELGHKAIVTNLSDIAAMGAVPTAVVIALAVPQSTRVGDLEDFARGAAAAIDRWAPSCGVVGGDLSTAPTTTIAVTAFGDLGGRTPVLRSGARPGDRIVVAGNLGWSGRGLRALLAGGRRSAEDAHPGAVRLHLAPESPIELGPVLADIGATAMLDVSDGLALDAARIARASGVTMAFSGTALAKPGVEIDDILFGGEDHALLATLPPGAPLPGGVRVIGEVQDGPAQVTLDGDPVEVRGWDPYRDARQPLDRANQAVVSP